MEEKICSETSFTEDIIPNKNIWNAIIILAIGLIIGSAIMMYLEYNSAKKFCSETNGEFKFKFPDKYFCSETILIKYSDGWDWDREIKFNYKPR